MNGKRFDLIEPLTWLEGRWIGNGKGEFPTMSPFTFEDQMQIRFLEEAIHSEPLIHFEEIAWVLEHEKKVFKHWETGFLKPTLEDNIQFYVSHNTGRIEVSYGKFDWVDVKQKAFAISFDSSFVRNDRGLTELLKSRRTFALKKTYFTYSLSMTTLGVKKLTTHLSCTLTRV